MYFYPELLIVQIFLIFFNFIVISILIIFKNIKVGEEMYQISMASGMVLVDQLYCQNEMITQIFSHHVV
jgi:hypothetical protein